MDAGVMFALIPIVFILVTGGVILLYPLARRLGDLLEIMTEERRRKPAVLQGDDVRDILVAIDRRLDRLEQHQQFVEQLASGKQLESGRARE